MLALENEIKSYDLYRNAADETDDAAGKQMYTWLASAERSHFNMLMSNYEALWPTRGLGLAAGLIGRHAIYHKEGESMRRDRGSQDRHEHRAMGHALLPTGRGRAPSRRWQRSFRAWCKKSKHLDILRGQYAAVTGSRQWVSMEGAKKMAASVDPLDIFPEADRPPKSLIPADASDEQALQMAMDFEQRGYKIYAEAAAEAASRRGQDHVGLVGHGRGQALCVPAGHARVPHHQRRLVL